MADERKVDQGVSKLERYHVVVDALQETKWFGCEVYRVGESVVLSAGREVPEMGIRQRGEGVAIVLSGEAAMAWRAGGSQWKARSSKLITSKLVTGSGNCGSLHVLSCYAPTFLASREEEKKFFNNLQNALSSIPPGESFVLMGDFNARVGSRSGYNDEWWYERGPRGYGDINGAGKELLSFLSVNEATICNTWFKKRDIQKKTWQYPKSLHRLCVDKTIEECVWMC